MATKQGTPAATAPEQPAATWDEHVKQTIGKLHSVYQTYVKPLEDRYKYDLFKPSWFEETILNSKPFVTFFGPWSAGKSTFINHLLQSNYMWTGPQPTTAEFTVVIYGEESGPLDGRVLSAAKDLPFKGLNEFGESFMNNFQGFQAPHDLLKSVMLVDTPGVLESAKDIHARKYDYIKLSRWFAERSDLVFVMFDPSKLDAGMELKMMFKHAFKGMESKVRIILNKADTVNTQELMRVYGSLFWNLSNMVSSTEPPRIYVGSFWDQPYKEGTFSLLFSEEKADLMHELTEVIPAQALDKKIASLIKRAKDVFVHAIIIGEMRSGLPMMFGKDKAKRQALDNLPLTYEKVGARYKMNHRDFPPVEEYRTFLEKFDLETFPPIEKVDKEGLLSGILNTIQTTLPRMLRPVKSVAVADPRNKEQRQEMQQRYHQQIADQYQGKQGIQGSSDVSASGLRASPMALVQPGQEGATILASNAGAAPAPTPAPMNQQAQMMQMMMMMQQQQQAQAPAPTAPAQPDPNAQMMQMMAMMQQMQGGGAGAAPQPVAGVPVTGTPTAPAPAPVPAQPQPVVQSIQKESAPVPEPTPAPAPEPVQAEPTPAPAPAPAPVETAPAPAAAPAAGGINLQGLTPEQQAALMQQLAAMQAQNTQPPAQ